MKELVIAEIIKLIIFRTFRSDTKASYRASAELIPAGHRIGERVEKSRNYTSFNLLTVSKYFQTVLHCNTTA